MFVGWWLRFRRRWGGVKSQERHARRSSRNPTRSTGDSGNTRQRILPDGGTSSADGGSGFLTARAIGILLLVLAAGQVLGILVAVLPPEQLSSTVEPIRFLYAIPLFDLIYFPIIFPEPATTVQSLFSLGYLAVYAVAGVWLLKRGGLPARFEQPLQMFFAGNAVSYAILPVFVTRAIGRAGFGGVSIGEYYMQGLTIPLIVIYGALMGLLYVAVGKAADSAAGTTPTEASGPGTGGAGTASEATARTAPETRAENSTVGGSPDPNASRATQQPHTATETRPSDPTRQSRAANEASSTAESPPPDHASHAGQSPSQQAAQPSSPDQQSAGNTATTPRAAAAETAGGSDHSEANRQQSARDVDATDSTVASDTTETPSADDETSDEISNLLSALRSTDRSQRLAAAERLGERIWEDPSVVAAKPLADALDAEPDAEIRMAIVNAVGALDSNAADEILLEARFDPDPNVSDRAGELLG